MKIRDSTRVLHRTSSITGDPMPRKRFHRIIAAIVVLIATVLTLSSCAGMGMFGDSVNRAFNGMPATVKFYAKDGHVMASAHGTSIRVTRDERFDTSDSEGVSKNDSSVLLISIGNSHIQHVGSTVVLAQDGLLNIADGIPEEEFNIENTKRGTPWANTLREKFQNLWAGKAKTIIIRSQDDVPIAIYAGNQVEVAATDVPRSTLYRIDGKYLFVYRANITTPDSDLLDQ